jgi:tetratricopeptide (TPR) repeat protein
VNQQQALGWITAATDPNLGGVNSFAALSTRSGLLSQLNRKAEADSMMQVAIANASAVELHQYGRQLLAGGKKAEAMQVFEQNFTKHKGVWPTHVGMMRGYSAMGNLAKALEHAEKALPQAPNEENKRMLEQSVKLLKEGKPL